MKDTWYSRSMLCRTRSHEVDSRGKQRTNRTKPRQGAQTAHTAAPVQSNTTQHHGWHQDIMTAASSRPQHYAGQRHRGYTYTLVRQGLLLLAKSTQRQNTKQNKKQKTGHVRATQQAGTTNTRGRVCEVTAILPSSAHRPPPRPPPPLRRSPLLPCRCLAPHRPTFPP